MLKLTDLDGQLVLVKASHIMCVVRHKSYVSVVTKSEYPDRTVVHLEGGNAVMVQESVEAIQAAMEAAAAQVE